MHFNFSDLFHVRWSHAISHAIIFRGNTGKEHPVISREILTGKFTGKFTGKVTGKFTGKKGSHLFVTSENFPDKKINGKN